MVDVAAWISTSTRSPGCESPAEVDRRVTTRPAAEKRRIGAARPLDEDLLDPTDARRVPPGGGALHDVDEPLHPLSLDVLGDLLGHVGSLGAGPRRVDEREGAVEADLLDDLERLGEVRLGLAREADDDVGAEREVRHRVAESVDERQIALARVRATHRLEDPRRAGLERQVHVLADGAALRDGRDHRRTEVLRVRAREPDPLDPLDGVTGAQKLAELRVEVRREVTSPRVDVLPEQGDLPDAVARERLDLGEDLARAPALLPPAHRRDDAVRALRVAAHRDLHPGAEPSLTVHRKRRGERVVRAEAAARHGVAPRLDPLPEVRDRSGAERDVDERIALEDPLALRLRVAAADRDDEIGMAPLPCGRLAEVRRELRVGLLADRARVEDEDVGVLGLGRLAQPERLEHALDPLRVVSVHLASERRDVVAPHRRKIVAASGPSPAEREPGERTRGRSAQDARIYFATSTARDSRITITLTCPGYSSWSSIWRAIS